MSDETLDQAKVSAFAQQVLAILNFSAQASFISIGHKTGLFDTLSRLPPSTAQQIAVAAGLDERYVREWLGGVVLSRIIDYDPATRTYALPSEHALVLTGADTTRMAGHVQNIPVLLAVEAELVQCFRQGGGLPSTAYPGFKLMVPVGDPDADDARFLESTLTRAPGLVERLEQGIDVAEIGCGAGHILTVMARAFPRSRFIGYDISADGIAAGQAEAQKLGLANVHFEQSDAAELAARDAFDFVIAWFVIHDLPKPRAGLAAIHTALRPGGTFFVADVRASSNLEDNLDHPLGPYDYLWSIASCMTTCLARGGEGLGTMWGEQTALAYLADAGFRDVRVSRPEDNLISTYYVCAKR